MNRGECFPARDPLILFGAFDRHNLGDLLLGETARALVAPRPVVLAGLAARDMSAFGGEQVASIAALAEEYGDRPAEILYVGGELLTCSLYEAAVMLQSDDAASRILARHDSNPEARHAWAASTLGINQPIAYLVPRHLFPCRRFVGCLGVGGVDMAHLQTDAAAQVLAQIAAADSVWVRDRATWRHLENQRVRTMLAPDPAELTAALFRSKIEARGTAGEPMAVRERYPGGYLAVQFSADFGDDATLVAIGAGLQKIQREYALGLVFFRTGAAPWHDRLDVFERLLERTPGLDAVVFHSLHLWDICALLAGCRGYAGSSLHGRIVAGAFGKPAASLASEISSSKAGIYVSSWRPQAMRTVAGPETLADAIRCSLQLQRAERLCSGRLASLAVAAANACRRALGLEPLPAAASI